MEGKQKVIFTLEGADLLNFEKPGIKDYSSDEERERAIKTRKGYFHEWGTTPNGGNVLSCGIVQDCEDGQIYCVPPANIKFEQ